MIQIENLSMTYKVYRKRKGSKPSLKNWLKRECTNVQALKNIHLHIPSGEIIGFIGPNGAGKTTLLKILSGLLCPTEGSVRVNSYIPFERRKEFKKSIALVMGQKSQLIWDIAAIETFNVNRNIYEVSKKAYADTLDELVSILDVEHCLQTPVRQLSLGERMKMELIASLLHSPKVLFLDEPTIGLDLKSQLAVREFIKKYNQKNQATTIITSHYMEDIKMLSQRLIMINHGSLIYDGYIEKINTLGQKYKYISLKTDQKVLMEQLSGMCIGMENQSDRYKFKIAPEKVNSIINILVRSESVTDLTIQNQPLEEMILEVMNRREPSC